ncbi:MAG: phosphoribosylamine--glycine ligase [Chthoniobacterales bacterium]
MKTILIVGSGGREHALAWKLAQSPQVAKILVAPGNAGTALIGENVDLSAGDVAGIVALAKDRGVDLVVIGPDDALAAGMVDELSKAGIPAFGPTAAAALLESSKAFAKDFMTRHGIPTAEAKEFTESSEAHLHCRSARYPLVVKADGLALGKGVVIAATPSEAGHAIYRAMDAGQFGEAGRRIVIEEFLNGSECSIHALFDGDSYLLLPDCRDHKQAHDGGLGPNTGGMGTVSPSQALSTELETQIREEILDRVLAGMKADGIDFRGMLFPGLMLTESGPKVLEFNCRWGDPETQVLVRRLESDLLDLLEACVDGGLAAQQPTWLADTAVCVVLASGGYPGSYEKGKPIFGLDEAGQSAGAVVFHAGTATEGGATVTAGGRVLGITAVGTDLANARDAAYAAADQIRFDKVHRRNDIGFL